MNSSYTSLESLLVFQALRFELVTPSTFNTISEKLQRVPLITNDPNYDSSRLTPDALKDLYLRLLKEEVKFDLEQQLEKEKNLTNGQLSPGSRKRKAPSPSLPTVNEAAQHAHLIPHLIARLYARYREESISTIREHEQRYDALTREVRDLVAKSEGQVKNSPAGSAQQLPANSQTSQGSLDGSIKNGPHVSGTTTPSERGTSTLSQSHLPATTTGSPRPNLQPNVPMLQPTNHGHPSGVNTPKSRGQSPYPVHPANAATSGIASPQLQNGSNRPSPSPQPMLQPNVNPNVTAQGGSRVGSPAITGPHPQHPNPSAMTPGPQKGYPPVAPQGAYYQQQGYRQQGQPIAYIPQQIHAAGYQNQQQWPMGQTPGQPQRVQMIAQQQQLTPRGNQSPVYPQGLQGHGQLPATAPRPQQVSRMVSDIVAALATPPNQGRKRLWKSDSRHPPLSIANMPPRPAVEPLSPTLKRPKSPARPTRQGRNRAASPPAESVEADLPARKGRRRGARDRSPASSVAGDAARNKGRSQSVSTAAGGNADDRPVSRGHIKDEPSTPAGMHEEPESLRDRSGTPASGLITRKLRGTTRNQSKQRQSSIAATDDERNLPRSPPPRSRTVTAYRNFAKISNPIMGDINGHKHAVYFQRPVTDEDVAGYTDIVKQPQDLKSIAKAITAGTKAVAAAVDPDAENGNIVELERTADLIPPAVIINGSQLEKEVYRVLANAAMFNPGDDGLVAEAREMFEAVERNLNIWRGAEREAGGEEEEDTKVKRRKL